MVQHNPKKRAPMCDAESAIAAPESLMSLEYGESMAELREQMCMQQNPDSDESAAAPPPRNFIAELMLEEARKDEIESQWLDQPKDGYATGREWAAAQQTSLTRTIEDLDRRSQRLWDNVVELHRSLTDSDVAGRLLHPTDNSPVKVLLSEAREHQIEAETSIERAKNDVQYVLPRYEEHAQMLGDIHAWIMAAEHQLTQGEGKLPFATGNAEARGETAIDAVQAASFTGHFAAGLATGGLSMSAQAAVAAAGEGGKQIGKLLMDDDVTTLDGFKAMGHTVTAGALGAVGSALPDVGGEGADRVLRKMAKSGATSAVKKAAHNQIDDKPIHEGTGTSATKSALKSLIPKPE